VRLRAAAAVLALATTAIGALIALEVQLAVITAVLVGMLVLERRWPVSGGRTPPEDRSEHAVPQQRELTTHRGSVGNRGNPGWRYWRAGDAAVEAAGGLLTAVRQDG
jgi:hypothetical protein